MPDLREQIQSSLGGRVCFMGLGNVESGDDGFGVRLAEALARAGVPDVLIGATAPEPLAGRCARQRVRPSCLPGRRGLRRRARFGRLPEFGGNGGAVSRRFPRTIFRWECWPSALNPAARRGPGFWARNRSP